MNADYLSFDDVLKALQLKPDELKRMVSSGELRAFRDQNEMKFRSDDVDTMMKSRQTDPTIILPSEEIDTGEVAAGADLDFGEVPTDEPDVPVIDAAQTATEEIVFEETDFEIGDDAADDEALATQELDSDQVFEDDEEYETETGVQFEDEVAMGPAAPAAMPVYAMPSVVQAEEGVVPAWVLIVMILAVIVMLFGGWAIIDIVKIDSDKDVPCVLNPGDEDAVLPSIMVTDKEDYTLNLPDKKSDTIFKIGDACRGIFGIDKTVTGKDPFATLYDEDDIED